MAMLNTFIIMAIVVDIGLLTTEVLHLLLSAKFPTIVFISDFLVYVLSYRVITTCFVFLQVITTGVYALSRRQQHRIECVFYLVTLAVVIVGWCVVAFVITNQNRSEQNGSFIHILGARLFAYGHIACFMFIIWDNWKRFTKARTWWHFMMFLAITIMYLLCGLFGGLFALRDDNDWIYEHMLFISFIVAHLLFFINTLQDVHDNVDYTDQFNMFNGIRLVPVP